MLVGCGFGSRAPIWPPTPKTRCYAEPPRLSQCSGGCSRLGAAAGRPLARLLSREPRGRRPTLIPRSQVGDSVAVERGMKATQPLAGEAQATTRLDDQARACTHLDTKRGACALHGRAKVLTSLARSGSAWRAPQAAPSRKLVPVAPSLCRLRASRGANSGQMAWSTAAVGLRARSRRCPHCLAARSLLRPTPSVDLVDVAPHIWLKLVNAGQM